MDGLHLSFLINFSNTFNHNAGPTTPIYAIYTYISMKVLYINLCSAQNYDINIFVKSVFVLLAIRVLIRIEHRALVFICESGHLRILLFI